LQKVGGVPQSRIPAFEGKSILLWRKKQTAPLRILPMVRAGCNIERFLTPGTGQSLLAGLERRCSRRICSRLLPFSEAQRRGFDASAKAGTSFGRVNQREMFSDWQCYYPRPPTSIGIPASAGSRPRSRHVEMVPRILAIRSSGVFLKVTSVTSVIIFVARER
jgi:hypothetical protein